MIHRVETPFTMRRVRIVLVTAVLCSFLLPRSQAGTVVGVEKDWGEGLKVLTTYLPEECEHQARNGDVIHYHYVGKLAKNGQEFGKSFDYDSPYIVTLGRGRIITGMDRGLVDMCLWERRRITIPPHLGYGKRGVGSIIPPDSTLVFYVRMIKIERSGQQLHKDLGLEELWEGALEAYGKNEWQSTVDLLEEGVKLYDNYENQTFRCLLQCREEASPKLSEEELDTISSYAGDDPVVRQLIVYAARAKCLRECKSKHLSPKLRYPDPEILQKFRKREVYSYLHFAYYQLDNYEEGARCFFTFAFYNPDSSLVAPSVPFYRKALELGPDEYVWREPGVQPHQEAYLQGRSAYETENYLEAVDHFESALPLYRQALDRCLLLCEDVLIMNITDKDMNPEKRAKLEMYSLSIDTLDYHSLLVTAVREMLECRVGCHDEVARINGAVEQNYLPYHFHYLQFSYYKLGQMLKTGETAATYLAMVPGDEVMRDNIRIYTSEYKLQPEDFSPREDYVAINLKLDTEKRLLHFVTHRQPKKKEGKRGDSHIKHQEL